MQLNTERNQFFYFLISEEPHGIKKQDQMVAGKWVKDEQVVHWKGNTNGFQAYGKTATLMHNKRNAH